MRIETIACDVDGVVPALTYTVTVCDGRSVAVDLCEKCSKPLEKILAEPVHPATTAVAQEPGAATARPQKRSPKPAAKKASSRIGRDARIATLEEIEALKRIEAMEKQA